MLKIAICDDDLSDLQRIYDLIAEYTKDHSELDISVTAFETSGALLKQIGSQRFHIYILDVMMDGLDGIEVGAAIRKADESAAIIYLTVSPDYALASYTVDAQYYFLKPVENAEFFRILERELAKFEKESETRVTVRTREGIHSIPASLVMYVELHYHIYTYHLTNGTVLESVTSRVGFDQALEVFLQDSRFVKISSYLIVNLRSIRKITPRGFLMQNGVELLVSRNYSAARRRYLDYMLKGMKPDHL